MDRRTSDTPTLQTVNPAPLFSLGAMSGLEMYDDVLNVLKAHYQERGFTNGVSQVVALQAASKALQYSIAVIGEQGVGKTTLVDALRSYDKQYSERDLPSFFSGGTGSSEPAGHVYPMFPNVVLWDLPGYSPSVQPAAYLKDINFQNYNILLLCVAGPVTENHLQLLKAFKQKGKTWYVVRSQVDLAVHTCKRRLRARYTLEDTLQELRKCCTQALEKAGLGSDGVFLVSGLEHDKYDFAKLEDALERDILSVKRNLEGNVDDFMWWSEEKLQQFYTACDAGGLVDLPVLLQSALDMPVNIRLDIGVIGEVGSGKSAFINAVRDLTLTKGDEAETGVIETTWKPTAFPHPEVPNVYFWDLPGFGTTELPIELYLKHLHLERYGFFIIVASERYKHAHSCLVKAITELRKKFFLVRNKIDSDLEASLKQRGSATTDGGTLQEKVRQSYLDALKKDVVGESQVFLVSSLDPHKFDMPQLREALVRQIPDLKKQVLLGSIPAIIFQVVRWKRKKLVKDACGKALQICLYAIEKPGQEAIDTVLSMLSEYAVGFGLDGNSQEVVAHATGKSPEYLQAEIRCPLVKAIDRSQITKLVSAPVPITSLVWNYMPYWGKASSSDVISLELTYKLLKDTIWDMAEDAERVLQKAYDLT